MAHLQKLHGRWLTKLATPVLDASIPENQWGFRANRQPSEILHVIHRITELHREWDVPVTLIKLDMAKAFDTIHQSAILEALYNSSIHPRVAFGLARDLVGSFLRPEFFGCFPPEAIALQTGSKQGAPQSGILFVSTETAKQSALQRRFGRRHHSCRINPRTRESHDQ